MKKLFCILGILVICFAVSAALAETITIPKAVIVPETFDQVPEQYRDQFNEYRWGQFELGENMFVSVMYNDGQDSYLNNTNLQVKVKLDVPGFTEGRYCFVGSGSSYDFFFLEAFSDNYGVNLYYKMEGKLFTASVWDRKTYQEYGWIDGEDSFIYFGDDAIMGTLGALPIDISGFKAPTIVYGEPVVLFPGAVEKKQGLVYEDGFFKYYENGAVNTEKFGFVSFEGGSFMVANGAVAPVNGLVQDPEHPENWYFCAGGQVQAVTSLVEYDHEWFFVENGLLNTGLRGFVDYNGGTFYIGAGQLQRQVNGLAQDPWSKEWYFCSQGQIQRDYTGLAQYDGAWFYVQKGKFDPAYNGTITYDGAEFNIVAGQPVL